MNLILAICPDAKAPQAQRPISGNTCQFGLGEFRFWLTAIVGVVLTYLLWGAVLKLRETRTRLIQLILALGVYFSATAGTYALRNLFPGLQESFLRWVPPLIGTWLPLAWAYTFSKVPEDARLMTARLVVRTR